MEQEQGFAFILRVIHNQIKAIIHRSAPRFERGPKSQLQGGILGYLYHHRDGPVYQRDIEKEFHVSRATATNTLQVMERDGLIVRQAMDKDARLKRIQLTGEAYANHMQIEAHMDRMESRMTAGMSEAEVAELRRLLGILMSNLEGFAEELGENQDSSGRPDMPDKLPPELSDKSGVPEADSIEDWQQGGRRRAKPNSKQQRNWI